MQILAAGLVGVVALIHLYILVLEMALWERPRTRKIFGTDADFAARTRVLAANQGLYNGFLAAGLIWGIAAGVAVRPEIALFFLACVAVAGLYGAATANRRILYVQTLPAALAAVFVLLA